MSFRDRVMQWGINLIGGMLFLSLLANFFHVDVFAWVPSARAAQTAPAQAEAPTAIIADTVADMPPNSQSNVPAEALVIGEDKKVWVNRVQPTGGDAGVIVHHMKDGSWEFEINDHKLRWLKIPINEEMRKILYPVAKVHITKAIDGPDKKK
jgi:hypothetical protein